MNNQIKNNISEYIDEYDEAFSESVGIAPMQVVSIGDSIVTPIYNSPVDNNETINNNSRGWPGSGQGYQRGWAMVWPTSHQSTNRQWDNTYDNVAAATNRQWDYACVNFAPEINNECCQPPINEKYVFLQKEAYFKWLAAGQPYGMSEKFWHEAEEEYNRTLELMKIC